MKNSAMKKIQKEPKLSHTHTQIIFLNQLAKHFQIHS